MTDLGFYVVNITKNTYLPWYDTDTLPPNTELPEGFADEKDSLRLVLLTAEEHDYFGLPYQRMCVQQLDQRQDMPPQNDWYDLLPEGHVAAAPAELPRLVAQGPIRVERMRVNVR